jgi:2-polyprenyl-6-methoxyphenol hydroxylase-like FAD-dependent oxidoreductase
MKAPKIDKLAVAISNDKPGSPAYLAAYHKARKQLEKELPETERQKYRAMAKKWSENKLPREMQQRYVHKNNPAGQNILIYRN